MRVALPVLMLVSLFAAAGCGASQAHDATADIANDPSWIPPGQGDLAVADAPVVEAKPKKKPRARQLQQPNHAEFGPLAATSGRSNR